MSSSKQRVPGGILSAAGDLAASDLTILIPVLDRPQNVVPVLQSCLATVPGATVLFISEQGDTDERSVIRDALIDFAEEPVLELVCWPGANYAAKINLGALAASTELIFTGADDLRFWENWLEEALAVMDEGIMVVGTNDACNPRVVAGKHSTHSLVRNAYLEQGTIDEPGKLLHEGYLHEWVDNEFVETAQMRGVYAHASRSVVEHLHPLVGKAAMDPLYEKIGERMEVGQRLFEERRPLWVN